jgi:hypothetical protein
MPVSFIGGGNRSTRRKPPTCRKSLKSLSHTVVSSTPRDVRDSTSLINVMKADHHDITEILLKVA